jgi:hypothetical protein
VAGTFLVFNLVTPTLRALSLLAVLTLPLSLRCARALYTVSRLAVAFSALDVMLVATPLISVQAARSEPHPPWALCSQGLRRLLTVLSLSCRPGHFQTLLRRHSRH